MASQWTLSFVSKSFFLLLPLFRRCSLLLVPSCCRKPSNSPRLARRQTRLVRCTAKLHLRKSPCLAALPNSAFSRRSRFHQFEDSIKHW